MNIDERIEQIYPELVKIRRDIHQHPELSEQEERTSKVVQNFLKEHQIPYQTGFADNGVVGVIEGKEKGKTVAVRADMDALPIQEVRDVPYSSVNDGVMHACGHDVHTTILLGTAKILNEMKEELNGNVKLLFQPAEETVGGAARMIQEGCMENPKVDYAIGLHVHSGFECGEIIINHGIVNAATGKVLITVKGKSGHGAHPESAVDAIVIASHIVVALQTVISRKIAATDAIVFTIGKISGGIISNIIADTVAMEGILRSLDAEVRTKVKEQIVRVVKMTAEAYGGSAEVEFEEGYIELVNNDKVADVIEEAAIETVGKEHVITKEPPSLASEDFAFFCKATKAAYYSIGCLNQSQGIDACVHNCYFDVDEECIKIGIKIHINTILKLLTL